MLQHNRIGDAGAAAIAQAVRGNVASKLTLLDLSENPLSAEKGAAGGKALAHMAQVSVTTCNVVIYRLVAIALHISFSFSLCNYTRR